VCNRSPIPQSSSPYLSRYSDLARQVIDGSTTRKFLTIRMTIYQLLEICRYVGEPAMIRGSVVSIAARIRTQCPGNRFPLQAGDSVRTICGAHRSPYPMGTGALSPREQSGRDFCVALRVTGVRSCSSTSPYVFILCCLIGARGSVDCLGAMLQAGRSRVRVLMRS
jgi:hypothetical protein